MKELFSFMLYLLFDLWSRSHGLRLSYPFHEEAIKSLCQRVSKRCQAQEQSKNSRRLDILLKYIENEPGRGRPRRAEPGSALALAVRRGLQEYPEQERPIAANQGIKKRQILGELDANIGPLNSSQIINIAEDSIHCNADPEEQRPLKRKRLLDKPELDDIARETRLEYCDTIDGYYAKESLLIMADEKQYTFGGAKKGTKFTLPRGVVGYTLRARKRFMIEQWAAGCSGDVSISRPHCCWSLKTQNLPELAEKLAVANQRLRQAVDHRRSMCNLEGTPEWAELRARNEKIRADNTRDTLDGLKGGRRLLTAKRLYPYEELKPLGNKGGLNFVWYAFEVYQKLLFPYYEAIVANNNGRDVLIIEDNDPSHLKARKLLAAEIHLKGIQFAPHLPNSPDFNLIETIQKHHQKDLETYSANITTAAKYKIEEAEAKLKQAWQGQEMDTVWKDRASNDALKIIANRCRSDKGGNHFRDDINTAKVDN